MKPRKKPSIGSYKFQVPFDPTSEAYLATLGKKANSYIRTIVKRHIERVYEARLMCMKNGLEASDLHALNEGVNKIVPYPSLDAIAISAQHAGMVIPEACKEHVLILLEEMKRGVEDVV